RSKVKMNIYKQAIHNFLVEFTGGNVMVEDDDSLLEAGVLTSLMFVQLLLFIEEQFNLTIDEDEMIPENFETINAIASLLEQKDVSSEH
ncbi:MAG: phosphopantetheine-binding protein, partial [Syntrophales bacterium]